MGKGKNQNIGSDEKCKRNKSIYEKKLQIPTQINSLPFHVFILNINLLWEWLMDIIEYRVFFFNLRKKMKKKTLPPWIKNKNHATVTVPQSLNPFFSFLSKLLLRPNKKTCYIRQSTNGLYTWSFGILYWRHIKCHVRNLYIFIKMIKILNEKCLGLNNDMRIQFQASSNNCKRVQFCYDKIK